MSETSSWSLCLPIHPMVVPQSWSLLCPVVPSVPKEVLEPTSCPATRTPIPGIALDPEKAGGCHGGLSLGCSIVFWCSRCHWGFVPLWEHIDFPPLVATGGLLALMDAKGWDGG